MPLRIKLTEGDRLVINGAVIESTEGNSTLIFHNHCDILRRREIMQEVEAETPARLVYYTIQCAYLVEDERPKYLKLAQSYLSQYEAAAPSARAIAQDIRDCMNNEQFYQALRATNALIAHEQPRLEAAQQSIVSARQT